MLWQSRLSSLKFIKTDILCIINFHFTIMQSTWRRLTNVPLNNMDNTYETVEVSRWDNNVVNLANNASKIQIRLLKKQVLLSNISVVAFIFTLQQTSEPNKLHQDVISDHVSGTSHMDQSMQSIQDISTSLIHDIIGINIPVEADKSKSVSNSTNYLLKTSSRLLNIFFSDIRTDTWWLRVAFSFKICGYKWNRFI